MNKVNWTVVVVFSIVALFILMFGASLLGGSGYGGWGYGGWGMMGPWMMGGMFFMWLFPVGFVVLIVLGIAWLVRSIGGNNLAGTLHSCPSCGRGVQTDWKNCPYCGTALTK
ncbi:MAG: zinc ribbon domain-containing protein [Anaerolineales bacterium]|nr:zinc ribbon domain-containing protein [Anaerolineales bacterium]